jgi:nucleoid-associated protein YgaU
MSPQPPATSFDHLLLGLAQWVLVGCGAWACLILVAALIEAGTRGRVVATSWVATPPAVRRLLLAGLGVALASGAPGPVSAAIIGGPGPRPAPMVPPGSSVTLPVPARPVGPAAPQAVVVRPGDTLWKLAASALPERATDAEIASATHRWYARNHRVIGPDPDLIRPGQRLRPPAHAEGTRGPLR